MWLYSWSLPIVVRELDAVLFYAWRECERTQVLESGFRWTPCIVMLGNESTSLGLSFLSFGVSTIIITLLMILPLRDGSIWCTSRGTGDVAHGSASVTSHALSPARISSWWGNWSLERSSGSFGWGLPRDIGLILLGWFLHHPPAVHLPLCSLSGQSKPGLLKLVPLNSEPLTDSLTKRFHGQISLRNICFPC